MTANSKDTIYVDIDDEITTIIDKVRSSQGRIIALVLPKRASVFQSVVNMKLLKRTAESAKKHIVLITTEASLMPLAGSVGLHVAPSLQSKPEVPLANSSAPDNDDEAEESLPDDTAEGYTAANAGDRPIGELAGGAAGAEGLETLSLPDDAAEEADKASPTQKTKSPFNKHLKVPNFNKFRRNLFLGVLLLVLVVVGLYFALGVLPKAAIAITTNATSVGVSLNMTLNTGASTLDTTKMIVPAKTEQQQKTTTQQVTTTGEKNTGDKAAGSVTLSAQKCAPDVSAPDDVPAGTGVSTNGLTFITQADASFAYDSASGSCVTYKTSSTDITAQSPGSKYNVTNADFTVAGRGLTGTGSADGGTDKIIHVVAQADIDNAKQKLSGQDTSAIKNGLEQSLRLDGMYPLTVTFSSSKPVITTSKNAGDEADSVTVTQAVTYTMFGAHQADLQTLIKNNISDQIDTKNQAILDDGLANANIGVENSSGTKAQLSLQATASVGPDINPADIKKQAAGLKAGDVKNQINQMSGVTSVDVRLSPFWVSSVPKDPNKITVTIHGTKQTKHGSG